MKKSTALESIQEDLNMRVDAMLGEPDLRDESERRACSIMLAALEVGPNVERMAELTGYEKGLVEEVAILMRASRLWTETGTDYGSWSRSRACRTKRECLDFIMDLFVARGILLRTSMKRAGYYVYQSLVFEGMKPI